MQLKMKELELEFAREKEPLFEKWLTCSSQEPDFGRSKWL
jgi:hypothetical protein